MIKKEINEPRHVISNNVVLNVWQVETQMSLYSLLLSEEIPKIVRSVA